MLGQCRAERGIIVYDQNEMFTGHRLSFAPLILPSWARALSAWDYPFVLSACIEIINLKRYAGTLSVLYD